MLRVGLADDQQLVRAGFSLVLDSQDDIEVVWQASDGQQACALAQSSPVDVILMDVQMPGMDGIAATRTIVDAGVDVRIIVLTTFDNDDYVMGSVEAGASGFLLKDADPQELISAVRTVGESAGVISPKATARLMRQVRDMNHGEQLQYPPMELPDPLTPREEEILRLMALGRSNPEIAQELFISLPTVKTHVSRVLQKTDSRDRVHAVLFAFKHGLVSNGELLA
ncbi:response regulator transcription factor [Corynebacterium sp. 320]|uniref:Response regulator transcription factor n=1 Tax=Corynebacterium zhongnanshanii TaxID=2768834 RepID=A0ABQ6VEV8_9CORY|nr:MULTISPECIES: response regulator transcription factor [Corynebacterium]KAB1504186.1 response regulator transcription factor [Corynebacterium sp. 320]KAB1552714.1 response regulator transcription factor [Corynebacterium sp. 321]KAB1554068.1 response regulator transcription factor [Corynebacterium sp. 319]KAB3522960.1 response regulator transcription factor [Corynebacterium zhongnanshanii]KAB3528322.1 response regulator transcription factor [Corynebacterium sp. 250]